MCPPENDHKNAIIMHIFMNFYNINLEKSNLLVK